MDKTVLLYFTSALAQSMAALFGVIGVFYVFRLQSLNSNLRHAYDATKEFFYDKRHKYLNGNNAKMWLDKDIMNYINDAYVIPEWEKSLTDYKQQICVHLNKKKELQNKIKFPLSMMVVIFLMNIIALPLSGLLANLWFFGLVFIVVVIFFTFRLIQETHSLILTALEDPKEVIMNAPGVCE